MDPARYLLVRGLAASKNCAALFITYMSWSVVVRVEIEGIGTIGFLVYEGIVSRFDRSLHMETISKPA